MQVNEKFLQRRVVFYHDVAEHSFNRYQVYKNINKRLNKLIVQLFKKLDEGGLLCEEDVEDALELLDADAIKELNEIRL